MSNEAANLRRAVPLAADKVPNPANLERLYAEFAVRLALHGGPDLQDLLPRGTPAQVAAEATRDCETLGERGGCILARAPLPVRPAVKARSRDIWEDPEKK